MLNGKVFSQYLIGARNTYSNIGLVKKSVECWDMIKPNEFGLKSYLDLVKFVKDRPGHDEKYSIDPSKIEKN